MLGGVVHFDLEGRLRKTSVPVSRPLLPVFEAVANSVHAIQQAERADGVVTITIKRGNTLDGEAKGPIKDIIIYDNGAGFTPDNYGAFETADTTHKIAFGGKGVGRFTWLVAFEEAIVESRYNESNGWRAFRFSPRSGIQDIPDYDSDLLPALGTSVTLKNFKSPWKEKVPVNVEVIAADLIEHFIALFVGTKSPTVRLVDGDDVVDLRAEFARIYDPLSKRHNFSVGADKFIVTGLRLRRNQSGRSHRLLYLADQREVKTESLSQMLPGVPNPLQDELGNFHYIGFVQSAALDKCVDPDRSSFRLPESEEGDCPNLFSQLTLREVRTGALGAVKNDLSKWLEEIDREKRDRIENFVCHQEPHYKVLLGDVDRIVADLPPRPSSADIDRAMSRRLFERRETLKTESHRLLSEMESVEQADVDVYRERMDKTVREYNELGVADLARYVCHRRVIIDLFEKALRLQTVGGKYSREDAIHSIVHPMRKTSSDVEFYSHNLWLLDERLAYNWRLYSDLPLSSVDVSDMKSRKEPDLLIFDHPLVIGGEEVPLLSATIVEFKRPGRRDYGKERVTTQVYNYLDLIRSGTYRDWRGRIIQVRKDTPVTIYIVADFTKELLRDVRDSSMRRMPDGDGFYVLNDDAYVELISYEKILQNARRRNRPFFHALGISTTSKE